MNPEKKKVIIAPLNWGWGHVTRCIPIIQQIKELGYIPVVACDGDALFFLKKEYPNLETITLASYGIKYSTNFKLSMFLNLPKIIMAVYKEHQQINQYIAHHKQEVLALISDNRLGVYTNQVTSTYITHQLNIKAGIISPLVNLIHRYFIKKHAICWIPDEVSSIYSGNLSRSSKIKASYIGILSRLKYKQLPFKYDLLVLLSGVEGQRYALECMLLKELKSYNGKVLFVRGTLKHTQVSCSDNIKVVNYLNAKELENAILSSKLVLTRSGYSTIMDLIKLNKQAFLIPTPGQTEQEYLAKYLSHLKGFNTCKQQDFKVQMLANKKDVNESKHHQHLLNLELKKFLKLSQE